MKAIKSKYSNLITIEGHLEHITYFNKETHYTVARLMTTQSRNPVTLVGFMAGVSPGEALKIQGYWETHPKYGQQFKIHAFEVTLPATTDGIRKYLESGVIKGIGRAMAGRLIDAFGAETFEVIEKKPEKLLAVEGIGQKKAAMVRDAWAEHHVIRGLMKFLQEMGVKTAFGAKIYKQYGAEAVDIIRADPYCLAHDFPSSGFSIADTIAQNLGVALDEPERVRSAIIHMLFQLADEGHSFAEEENLVVRCENLFQINRLAIAAAVEELIAFRRIVRERLNDEQEANAIFLANLHRAESDLAGRLKALMSVPTATSEIDAEGISKEVQRKLAIHLSAEQVAVLEKVFSHRVAIITGGPGTGKTTLLRSIAIVFEKLGKTVRLAAPTGRASRRLTEVTGRKARTIHRLLGYNLKDGQFLKNRDEPIDADVIIVDEASMVDIELMHRLVQAVPMSAMLILVGDMFQLPSVGPGNVLADMIRSEEIPVYYLNEIFRQDQQSAIVINAHRVRSGELPEFETIDNMDELSDFYFLEQSNPDQVVDQVVQLCKVGLPQQFNLDPANDIQVLSPMHKGIVGTINLNQKLQRALNPNPVLIEHMGNAFKLGDKVMHLRNNYQKDVYNGDIGIIRDCSRNSREITVDYYGHNVKYDHTELEEISIAYAISVHKSQGSEYPAVIVPLVTQHYVLLQRNLLYTAMTRGQKLVILIGSQKALNIALNNDKPQQRLTRLSERLRA
jgi:exodeoxyribonuclease V alpha subunit